MSKNAVTWWACTLLCMCALLINGCGEEDNGPCEEAARILPSQMKGELSLQFQGTTIGPFDVRVQAQPHDCSAEVTLTQSFNPICGTRFKGTLDYVKAETQDTMTGGQWVGSIAEESGSGSATQMSVKFVQSSIDTVRVWTKMTDSNKDICRGRIISGNVRAEK